MIRPFLINQTRSKEIHPDVPYRLRQVDFSLRFEINPGQVAGWYEIPRQIASVAEMEVGTVHLDYGPNVRAGRLSLSHPLVSQSFLDSLEALSHLYRLGNWMLWNHRGDRFEAAPTDGFKAKLIATIPGLDEASEPARIGALPGRYIFDYADWSLFYVREDGGWLYYGEDGADRQTLGQGTDATVASSTDGRRYAAYGRGGKLYLRAQDPTGAWLPEMGVLRTGDGPEAAFDPAARYHSPWLVNVFGRMWLFYLKSVGGESVIQYRLESQDWLEEHTIPTLGGPKDSVRALTYRGSLEVLWINWDVTRDDSTARVPNLYMVPSTPPQVTYATRENVVARQGNYVPVKDAVPLPYDALDIEFFSVTR